MPECSSFTSYNPTLRKPLNHAIVRTPGAFLLGIDPDGMGGQGGMGGVGGTGGSGSTISEIVFCHLSGNPPLDTTLIDENDECPNKSKSPTPDSAIHPFTNGIMVAWKMYWVRNDGACDVADVWDFTFSGASRVVQLDFDGNLNDSSGNANHGTAPAMKTPTFVANNDMCQGTTVDGVFGKAACLDGVDDEVTITDTNGLDSPKTLALFFRPLNLMANSGLIDKFDGNVGGSGYFLSLALTNGPGRVDWSVNNTGIGFPATVGENVWSHVVITHEAGAQILYVNGEAVPTTGTSPDPVGANALDLTIGVNRNGVQVLEHFKGLMGGLLIDGEVFNPADAANDNCWRRRSGGITVTPNCTQ